MAALFKTPPRCAPLFCSVSHSGIAAEVSCTFLRVARKTCASLLFVCLKQQFGAERREALHSKTRHVRGLEPQRGPISRRGG